MLCPLCKVEMGISSSQHVIKSVDGEQKLFVRQILSCRNHNCSNYQKEVQAIENELPVLKEERCAVPFLIQKIRRKSAKIQGGFMSKLPFNLQFFADNDISANTQEVADPVETTAEVVEEPVNEVEESSAEVGATEQAPAEPAAQSQELNAQFAAARRKAEEDYQRKMSGIDGEFKRLFGNQVNPATGRPISSVAEYLQAVEFAQNAARNEELRSKGIDPTMIQEMVNNAPAVRQAQQYLQMTQQEEARKSLEADFKEITKIDPSIKSMEDLQKHASFNTVLAYVRDNGLKLHDAFRLANYQQLTSNNADAARQAALNQARGKQHMETTNGVSKQGKELVQIPSNLLSMWQDAYPGMSLEQLTQKYNNSI